MLILVPLGCFVAIFGALLMLAPSMPWKRAVLSASLIWGVSLTASTELLSLLNAFTFLGVLISWCITFVLTLTVSFVLIRRIAMQEKGESTSSRMRIGTFTGRHAFLLPLPLRVAFVAVLAMIAVIAVIGIIAPPNNWDSMTFHMARVSFWIEHGTVEPYPTDIMRQLYEAPWAESTSSCSAAAIAFRQWCSGGVCSAVLLGSR